MSHSRWHQHTLHCILPPHLARAIAVNGSPAQRTKALRTVAHDNTFRALRLALSRPTSASLVRGPSMMMAESQRQRIIYDMQNKGTFPGIMARSENQQEPTNNAAVDEAFVGLGATYDFFWEVFGRNSIDGEGMPLLAHVHYEKDYNNAFWDGQRMVFGDGDGDIFNRFTIAVDVIGHELTHGVTEHEGPLTYFRQAGALNESLSDVFGSLVKQKLLNQTADKADWLIGAGLFTANIKGKALRSMKEPGTAYDDPVLGKDPQPGHMDQYVRTFEDNGGVHINSGIPNRAFYLLATRLGGYAWEKAGRIWFEALREPRLKADSHFLDFARITVQVAGRLYGMGKAEEEAVEAAWGDVGIKVSRVKVSVPAWVAPAAQPAVAARKPTA